MTPLTENILSIDTLDPQSQKLVEQVETTRCPLFFTREGQSTVVMVEASVYEEVQKQALLKDLERSRKEIAVGQFHTQEEVETMLDEWLPDDE